MFILGCPRSGTTLLYDMLLSAGGFAVYPVESNIYNLLLPRFGDLSVLKHRRKLMNFWLGSSLSQIPGLNAAELEAKILAECKRNQDFLPILMGEIARQQGVERWAEKTPEHLLHIPTIKEAVPEALFIHIIRDGRDVAFSLAKKRWVPRLVPWSEREGLLITGIFWEWIVEKGRGHGALLGSDYVEVHYEDLLQQPRETLSRLGEFIEHDLDYDRVRSVAIGSVRKPDSSFQEEFDAGAFDPVGRWKKNLERRNLARLEALIGDTLTEFGYSLVSQGVSVRDVGNLGRLKKCYRAYFEFRLWLKLHTPLARFLTDTGRVA